MLRRFQNDYIIIADIASPQTIKNIKQNNKVSISFIDILIQKGCQINGQASIKTKGDKDFVEMKVLLEKMTKGKFPFSSITSISIDSVKPILPQATSSILTRLQRNQINNAKKNYGF